MTSLVGSRYDPAQRVAQCLCGILFSISLLILTSDPAFAQAGRLDSTFGMGGKVLTNVPGPTTAIANAMALQSDGKVVVAGGLGDGQAIGVVRYNSNGTLDTRFGQAGIALANIPTNILSSATGLVIQSDDKIVAAGTIYLLSGAHPFIGLGVVRFNPNGTMDSTFGQAGLAAALPFNATQCAGGPTALQPDGKILLAGSCSIGSRGNIAIVQTLIRLNPNGSLDSTFGTGGAAVLAEAPNAIALQSDGKILIAGAGALSRYNSNGGLDATFGIFGSVGGVGTTAALAIQSDGKILVAGTISDQLTVVPDGDFAVVRYNPDGSVDQSFASRGGVLADFFSGSSGAAAFAIALQSNGDIVLAGKANQGTGASQFAVARFTSSGSLDKTFGTGGIATTSFGETDSIVAIAVQADGKIVAAGNSLNVTAGSDAFALARYLGF